MLVDLANELAADWMLIGGVSVASWGEPRGTDDIDIAFSVSMDLADPINSHLTTNGFSKLGGPGQIKTSGIYLVKYGKRVGDKIAEEICIFFTMTEWQRLAIERRRNIKYRDRILWTASPEDLVIYKLLADRGIDQDDIDNVLDVRSGQLDQIYVDTWTRTLGIHDRWIKALTRLHNRRDMAL